MSTPEKVSVKLDDKCGKCRKTVKNGILCKLCDRWWHFKCGKRSREEKFNAIEDWFCDQCVTNIVIGDGGSKSKDREYENALEIINILRNDIEELKAENDALKDKINVMECKYLNCGLEFELDLNYEPVRTETVRPKNCRRWESVPVKYAGFKKQIKDDCHFPVLKNRFEPLASGTHESVDNSSEVNLLDVRSESNKNIVKPSCKTSRKSVKIRLFADSQGRNIASELIRNSKHDVSAVIKPGANFNDITSESKKYCEHLGATGVAVYLAGTNDVGRNNTRGMISSLRSRLQELHHTNVVVFSVPHRHDLPAWSCVNKEVNKVNEELLKICRHFKNVKYVDISNLGRRFHTWHGLHLNRLGKRYVVNSILEFANAIKDVECKTSPIPLKN
ncbi:uncharacterized protein [Anabrus simplex]|uniref:uncharacterized protein n=1 Tax=Anabrus simplex TaxID=316456 RepID=UPI0035A34058